MTKSRASRHYHSRSRSRSPSRNKSERTRKALKPRESIHTSVKERLETKKTGDARSLLTRSDVRTCDSSVSKKSVSNKDSKLTTDLPLANGAILGSKHKTVTVRDSEVKTKQQKDLRSRLSEKKADQSTDRQKKPVGKDSTKVSREQELDARIQRIKQQNEVILKRAKEIQAEKNKFR